MISAEETCYHVRKGMCTNGMEAASVHMPAVSDAVCKLQYGCVLS